MKKRTVCRSRILAGYKVHDIGPAALRRALTERGGSRPSPNDLLERARAGMSPAGNPGGSPRSVSVLEDAA